MLGDDAAKLQRWSNAPVPRTDRYLFKKTQASDIVVHTSTLRAAPGCITEPTCALYILYSATFDMCSVQQHNTDNRVCE